MAQSLFEFSSHAVRNAIVNGQITNVSHLPLTLRRWIFEMVRMKQMLSARNVVRVFEQAGFFDGFTTISMHDKNCSDCIVASRRNDKRYGHFLSSLATVFGSNQPLAEDITELSLCISKVCHASGYQLEKNCVLMDVIEDLLHLCKNLKRLQLSAFGCLDGRRVPVLHSFSETANFAFRQLEHLSLIGSHSAERIDQFPRQWFRSIQSLELCRIDCNSYAYAEVLECCRDTLVSLKISDGGMRRTFIIDSPVPICLPNLISLTFESEQPRPRIFSDIQKHCPSLQTATLKIPTESISRAELNSVSELSKRLCLYLTGGKAWNFSEFLSIAGESVVGLEIHRTFFSERDFESISSHCSNLSLLQVTSVSDDAENFLEDLFADKERAMKLTELYVFDRLPQQLLKLIFANCSNLRHLKLTASDLPVDLSSDLQLWIGNGARPISLLLSDFEPVCPDIVYSIMKASGSDLRNVTLNVKCDDEEVPVKYANVLCNNCPYLELCLIEFDVPISLENLALLQDKGQQMCYNSYPVM